MEHPVNVTNAIATFPQPVATRDNSVTDSCG